MKLSSLLKSYGPGIAVAATGAKHSLPLQGECPAFWDEGVFAVFISEPPASKNDASPYRGTGLLIQ